MKVSSKLMNVDTLYSVYNIQYEVEQGKLLLMTSSGLVVGRPVRLTEEESSACASEDLGSFIEACKGLNVLRFLPTIKNLSLKDKSDLELTDDGSLLVLEDVKIYKNNFESPVFSSNIFYIHSVDIVGFCIIPEDHPLNQC